MTIDSSEISVIVQGAIDLKYTYLTIASIKRHLPDAEIIVSTWDDVKNSNKNTESLQCSQLVLSKDPGFTWCDLGHTAPNNVNRQIVSTINGLKKSTRKYCLKLRSDLLLIGTEFLDEFGKYDKFRNEKCKVFKNRIITNNLYCADPMRTKFCFHISDWFQFGLREDLIKLWDIPLQTEDDAHYFKTRPAIDKSRKTWQFRHVPEQYIFMNCLKKNGVVFECDFFSHNTKENILLSDLCFANNTVILDYDKCGIQFVKYDPYKHDSSSQMSHAVWKLIYRDHCNFKFDCDDIVIDRSVKSPSVNNAAHQQNQVKKKDWWRGVRGNRKNSDKRNK